MCDITLSRLFASSYQFKLRKASVTMQKMAQEQLGNYLYGKYHQGLPVGTVIALRALLLRHHLGVRHLRGTERREGWGGDKVFSTLCKNLMNFERRMLHFGFFILKCGKSSFVVI